MFCMPAYMVLPVFFWGSILGAIGAGDPSLLMATAIVGVIWYFVIMKTNWYPRSREFINIIRAKIGGKKA